MTGPDNSVEGISGGVAESQNSQTDADVQLGTSEEVGKKEKYDRVSTLGRAVIKIVRERQKYGLGNDFVRRKGFSGEDAEAIASQKPDVAISDQNIKKAERSSFALTLQAAIQVANYKGGVDGRSENSQTIRALIEVITRGHILGLELNEKQPDLVIQETRRAIAIQKNVRVEDINIPDKRLTIIASKSFSGAPDKLNQALKDINRYRLNRTRRI